MNKIKYHTLIEPEKRECQFSYETLQLNYTCYSFTQIQLRDNIFYIQLRSCANMFYIQFRSILDASN